MHRSAAKIKDVNTRYHDMAADGYDAKWGIDFGETGQDQVVTKLRKTVGDGPPTYKRSLEIGAGTGYFTINLAKVGLLGQATATDISPGMLEALQRNAQANGVPVKTIRCDAESLPFEEGSFDLVFGHAVLHHIPDLDRAFAEFHRVLAPGGTIAFCGEPSGSGDRLAAVPKRVGTALGPVWRTALQAELPVTNGNSSESDTYGFLESQVDVHTFTPVALKQFAQAAGFVDVRVAGEELLANVFGWLARTLEASAEPNSVPLRWRNFVFKTYLALQKVDSSLLERRLPPSSFYNLLISARKPQRAAS